MKKFLVIGALIVALMLLGSTAYALTAADVLFVVDESGSMAGEHAWLASMVTSLEAGLIGKGIGDGTDGYNQYGLIGFGTTQHGTPPPIQPPHKHVVGSVDPDWGTAAELSAATAGLVTYGGIEDGWAAIDFALNNYAFRSGAALNVILITDEPRSSTVSLTYAGMEAALKAKGALLNTVVNATFTSADGLLLGIDAEGNTYREDGGGGFLKGTGPYSTSASGNTKAAYIDLALATGGAAWALNQLRAGGNTAVSFTNAFVDIKVEEIQQQQVIPEPSTLLLLGVGLIGMFALGRKKLAKK